MNNEQQSWNLLPKVDPRSIFRNNFLQPAQGEKREISTQNLLLEKSNWGFLYLVFRRLKELCTQSRQLIRRFKAKLRADRYTGFIMPAIKVYTI